MIIEDINFEVLKKSKHSGYITNESLSGIQLIETLNCLEPIQSNFLNSYLNEIPVEYKRKWPVDKLHWWSRPEEYAFIISNVLDFKEIRKDGVNILEFGPGCSFIPYLVNKFLSKNANFYMEDIDNNVINFWKGLMESQGRNIINHNSIMTPKYEYFDLIYSVSVLEHIQNPSEAIKKLVEQLKTGGRLIMTLDVDLSGTGKNGLVSEDFKKLFHIKGLDFDLIPAVHVIQHLDDIATANKGWWVNKKDNENIINRLKSRFKTKINNPKNISVIKIVCTKK